MGVVSFLLPCAASLGSEFRSSRVGQHQEPLPFNLPAATFESLFGYRGATPITLHMETWLSQHHFLTGPLQRRRALRHLAYSYSVPLLSMPIVMLRPALHSSVTVPLSAFCVSVLVPASHSRWLCLFRVLSEVYNSLLIFTMTLEFR